MPGKMNFQTVPLTTLVSMGITAESDPVQPVILVVDDETVIADTLSAILTRSGMTTLTAYNARSALRIAQNASVDLLLTDVLMPGMSGIELAIAVRQILPDCKIMLFSGQASTIDLLSEARAAGHEFTALSKPLHPTELLARISELLSPQSPQQSGVTAGGFYA